MIKFLIAVLVIISLSGCTDKETTERILKNDGFSNITITGYNFFACSKDDIYHTGFIAKKGDKKIEGTVCSGLIFKNSTIRFK